MIARFAADHPVWFWAILAGLMLFVYAASQGFKGGEDAD